MEKIKLKGWIISWTAVRLIVEQSLRSVLLGWGAYIAWALGFGGVLLLVRSTLGEIQTGYSTVIFEPMVIPMMGMAIILAAFVAFMAGVSVARERELGTLETLFYGPIHYRDYILGKIIGYWAAYVAMMGLFLLVCVWLGWVTHFVFSGYLVTIAVLSLFAAIALIGGGVLAAALTRSVRGSVFLLLGILIMFLGLPLASGLLTSVVSSQEFTNLTVLRDSVQTLSNLVAYVSPVAYLFNGADAILRGSSSETMGYLLASVAYGITIVFLAIASLRRRGVAR
jgi:ABC-type transport system involved in multi-copper enzyme maturation permease subunit